VGERRKRRGSAGTTTEAGPEGFSHHDVKLVREGGVHGHYLLFLGGVLSDEGLDNSLYLVSHRNHGIEVLTASCSAAGARKSEVVRVGWGQSANEGKAGYAACRHWTCATAQHLPSMRAPVSCLPSPVNVSVSRSEQREFPELTRHTLPVPEHAHIMNTHCSRPRSSTKEFCLVHIRIRLVYREH
jgi:hypothetical protein